MYVMVAYVCPYKHCSVCILIYENGSWPGIFYNRIIKRLVGLKGPAHNGDYNKMEVESVSHQRIFNSANDDICGVHMVNIVNNQNIRDSRNVLNTSIQRDV